MADTEIDRNDWYEHSVRQAKKWLDDAERGLQPSGGNDLHPIDKVNMAEGWCALAQVLLREQQLIELQTPHVTMQPNLPSGTGTQSDPYVP